MLYEKAFTEGVGIQNELVNWVNLLDIYTPSVPDLDQIIQRVYESQMDVPNQLFQLKFIFPC